MSYTLYFDGCCKGNPGIGSLGVALFRDEEEIWNDCKFIGNKETNNSAEYSALIHGLNYVIENNITDDLIVKGDSQLVIRQMLGEYKVKSLNLLDSYQKAKKLITKIPKIKFIHVPREENLRADELANYAILTTNKP